jgi:hypothetical protein
MVLVFPRRPNLVSGVSHGPPCTWLVGHPRLYSNQSEREWQETNGLRTCPILMGTYKDETLGTRRQARKSITLYTVKIRTLRYQYYMMFRATFLYIYVCRRHFWRRVLRRAQLRIDWTLGARFRIPLSSLTFIILKQRFFSKNYPWPNSVKFYIGVEFRE